MKPVILLPVSALAGLSTTQVEAIMAHELAHIRRHDYLVNLLQTLLETLLFYHPAVWWLSRGSATSARTAATTSPSACAEIPSPTRARWRTSRNIAAASGHLVMAASGGPLLQRVRRLLLGAPAPHAGRGPVWLAGATALMLMAG